MAQIERKREGDMVAGVGLLSHRRTRATVCSSDYARTPGSGSGSSGTLAVTACRARRQRGSASPLLLAGAKPEGTPKLSQPLGTSLVSHKARVNVGCNHARTPEKETQNAAGQRPQGPERSRLSIRRLGRVQHLDHRRCFRLVQSCRLKLAGDQIEDKRVVLHISLLAKDRRLDPEGVPCW